MDSSPEDQTLPVPPGDALPDRGAGGAECDPGPIKEPRGAEDSVTGTEDRGERHDIAGTEVHGAKDSLTGAEAHGAAGGAGCFGPPVEVCHLVKTFPSPAGPMRRAVDDISFHVQAGEIYGLLGPNGAGKTTTLRILSGLMQPTSGRVFVSGIDVQTDPLEAKRRIGFLTANTGLYQRLSPRELLPYFAELNGIAPETSRRRVAELIDLLGMHEFADLRCGALSTGQKQRTNIARALIADPPVLVMDEPTLGLDVLTNRTILDFIRRERTERKAILLSTHYLDEAETLCDRIGLLHEGRLVAEGTMPELRARTGLERLTEIFLHFAGEVRG